MKFENLRLITTCLVFLLITGFLQNVKASPSFMEAKEKSDIESFENGDPEGWIIYNIDGDNKQWKRSNAGAAKGLTAHTGEWVMGVGFNSSGNDDWLVSAAIEPTTENHTFSFYATSNYNKYLETFEVKLAPTGVNTEDFTVNLATIEELPYGWTQYSYDLTDYIGQTIHIAVRCTSTDKYEMLIDDVEFPAHIAANDLAISNFKAPIIVGSTQSTSYTIDITNKGSLTQETYTIALMNSEEVLTSINGQTIAAGETKNISIDWTAQETGDLTLYCQVNLENDENLINNKTNTSPVKVVFAGSQLVVTGEGSIETDSLPVAMSAKTSFSQSIYLQNEIGHNGLITNLIYNYDFSEPETNRPTKIWMGTTSKTDLSEGWIPLDELTLVYDGSLTYSKNDHNQIINLQTPFVYESDNLVVLYSNPEASTSYNQSAHFTADNRSATPNRTRCAKGDWATSVDPANPPACNAGNVIPNLGLVVMTSGITSLTGKTLDTEGQPVENVRISIQGTNFVTTSDDQGNYNFPHLAASQYPVKVTCYGYSDIETTLTLSTEPHTHNFTLTERPKVQVSGKIIASDNLQGIQNATVKLDGYGSFETLTDSEGNYVFPQISCNNEYTLTVTAVGYNGYTAPEPVIVANEAVVLNEITLTETPFAATNVVATLNADTTVNLIWEMSTAKNSGSKSIQKYIIYRYLTTNQWQQDLWVELANDVTEMNYFDATLKQAASGIYKYAIKTVYSGNIEAMDWNSSSNEIECNMEIDIPVAITNQEGQPISQAKIYLESKYLNAATNETRKYQAITGEDGAGTLSKVHAEDYNIYIWAEGYDILKINNVTIDLQSNLSYTLNEIFYTPNNVKAETENNKNITANVSWEAPNGTVPRDFRYDDGTVVFKMGINQASDKAMLGTSYRHDALIEEVSWLLTSDDSHQEVIVFIFETNEYGVPDVTKLLHKSDEIANTDDQWNTYELPEPIRAENGFYIGIATPYSQLFVGMDDGWGDGYDYEYGTEYGLTDYTDPNGAIVTIAGYPYNRNFTIRAHGKDFGELDKYAPYFQNEEPCKTSTSGNNLLPELFIGSPVNNPIHTEVTIKDLPALNTKTNETYKLFCLKKGQEEDETSWTTIQEGISTLSIADATYNALEMGLYRYAVKTEYGDTTSMPIFSNILAKDMTAPVTINLSTNEIGENNVIGTEIVITNTDGNSDHIYTTTALDAQVIINDVWKGTYTLTAQQEGFEPYTQNELNLSNAVNTIAVELTEIIVKPYNLVVENLNQGKATLSWNNPGYSFEESFETYTDFAIDFTPWTNIDEDGLKTYVINAISYPNNDAAKSFMVFNPKATTPVWEHPFGQAHSGDKYAACFAADNENGPKVNNDWLISPQFEVGDHTFISFFAKSFFEQYGMDRFTVGISTTGTATEDFTTISTGEYLEVSDAWTSFNFDLSAYADKQVYIAIHCISPDRFMFMVDDFKIGDSGVPQNTKSVSKYVVSLDGTQVTETEDLNCTLSGLVNGTEYTASIKTVYTSGESENSEITFTYQFTNHTPEFTSEAITASAEGELYEYHITATDSDNDLLSITSENLPQWLTLTDNGDGTALLSGTPDQTGSADVKLIVNDGELTATQNFTIDIAVGIDDIMMNNISIYPNPAKDNLIVKNANQTTLLMINAQGKIVYRTKVFNEQHIIPMDDFNPGLYLIKLMHNQNIKTFKVIHN